MPIFTQPISQQNTATSAGVSFVPSVAFLRQYSIIGDQFNRLTLNPTGALALYATAVVGTGTATIVSGNFLSLVTSATSADNVSTRMSEQFLSRGSLFVDPRTQFSLDILFNLQTGATSEKMFVGIAGINALTAIPTTSQNMGIYYDSTAGSNFMITSANGSTQVTTDTGQAADTSIYRVNITRNGDNSGTISFYSSANGYTNLIKSYTQTSYNLNSDSAQALQFYIETATTSARELRIKEWGLSAI